MNNIYYYSTQKGRQVVTYYQDNEVKTKSFEFMKSREEWVLSNLSGYEKVKRVVFDDKVKRIELDEKNRKNAVIKAKSPEVISRFELKGMALDVLQEKMGTVYGMFIYHSSFYPNNIKVIAPNGKRIIGIAVIDHDCLDEDVINWNYETDLPATVPMLLLDSSHNISIEHMDIKSPVFLEIDKLTIVGSADAKHGHYGAFRIYMRIGNTYGDISLKWRFHEPYGVSIAVNYDNITSSEETQDALFLSETAIEIGKKVKEFVKK